MITTFKKGENNFTALILILFTAGLIFHLIDFTREYVMILTTPMLLISNSIVLYFVLAGQKDKTLMYWSIAAFFLTFLIELAGVKTGLIFGEYYYGKTMLFHIMNVPLIIGINWVVLILGSYAISSQLKIHPVFLPLLSSAIIVGFDFIMEEVAMKLDYWQWKDNTVPLNNYIAWFFISLIFSSVLTLLKVKSESKILMVYFIVQLMFFSILRVVLS